MKRLGLGGIVALCALAIGWPAASAQAQTYRCMVQGRQVLSDRPCTPGASTGLKSYVAKEVEPAPTRTMQYGSPNRAPDHLQYLSPECAQLNDAIRTASARGVGHAVQRDLQTEYHGKCGEDDGEARRQLSQVRSAERQVRREERETRANEKAMSQRERDQCHEMLRILHGKRQRATDLGDGERADLQRFEANYNARCKG